jgi:hypothetical protein
VFLAVAARHGPAAAHVPDTAPDEESRAA